MKLNILISVIFFCIILLLKKKNDINIYKNNILTITNKILLNLNIFDIKYPESYINDEKILGLKIRDIEKDAFKVYPILKQLKQKDYFRIFKVNLNKTCKNKKIQTICNEKQKCNVCECDDDKIPYKFRTNEMEIIENKMTTEDLKKAFIEDKLYNDILGIYDVTENDGFISYVDLVFNSPSHTAYEGENIWSLIYKENCFINETDTCKEIKSFYNIISGMQSNIAVLASEYYNLLNNEILENYKNSDNKFKFNYYPEFKYDYNLNFFRDKIAFHPDRIENLYFTFAILLRSVCRLKNLFKQCKCNSGYEENDKEALILLNELLNAFYYSCDSKEFLEPLFPTQGKEVLTKFTNIIKILDCVPCIKCRLHGKLKTTALQIALVESLSNKHIGSLERNEITAMINTLFYFADSIKILKRFQERLKLRKTFFFFFFSSILLFIFLFIYSVFFIWKKKRIKVKDN